MRRDDSSNRNWVLFLLGLGLLFTAGCGEPGESSATGPTVKPSPQEATPPAANYPPPGSMPSSSVSLSQEKAPTIVLPPEAAADMKQGVAHYRQGRYREAAEFFSKARDIVPDHPQVSNFLATAYLHAKQYKPARAEFERLLSLQPEAVEPRLGLARIAIRLGDFEEATQHFREVLEVDPDHLVALFNLGRLRYRAGDYQEASDLIQKVVQQQPDHWQARYILGQTYVRLGKYDLAEREFLEVVRLKPRNAQAHFNLAKLYRRLGWEKETQEHEQLFLSLQDQESSDRAAFGRAGDMFRKGDFEGALQEFNRLAELDPTHGWYQVGRGQCLFKMGRTEEAIAAFEKAASIDPQIPEPFYFLAILYEQQGEYQKSQRARAEFEKLEAMSDPKRDL